MLVISMFIMEEYLSEDKVKGELLSNIWYKICDFLYQFIFIDMGACIVINIIISGKWLKDWFVQTGIQIWWFYVVNIIILLFTIHLLNEELILYRKLAKQKLHKSILSEKDNELFYFRAKTYLERHSDNSKISRINSIYGMSRSLALSSLVAILFTVVSYFLNDKTFYVFGTKSICPVLMIIIELFVFALFCYRTKRYAKYKVRVIMRYYWDEMKCNK